MWDKIIEFSKQIFSLSRDLQQCKTDIEELQERDKSQDLRINELTDAVRRLVYELKHDRDMSERDRDVLLLRLENTLLRFERRLPPGAKVDADDV